MFIHVWICFGPQLGRTWFQWLYRWYTIHLHRVSAHIDPYGPRKPQKSWFWEIQTITFFENQSQEFVLACPQGPFFSQKGRIWFWRARRGLFFSKSQDLAPPGVILQNWWRVVPNQTWCAKSDGGLFKIKFRREVASSQVPRIAARSPFLEFATGATGAAGAGEVVAGSAARTPHPTRAGGQDDGSYTNSLKQLDKHVFVNHVCQPPEIDKMCVWTFVW